MFRRNKERKTDDEKKKKRRSTSSIDVKNDSVVVTRRRPSSGKLEVSNCLSLRKCSVTECKEYTVNFIAKHGHEGISLPVCEKCVDEMKKAQGFKMCDLCEKEKSGEPCNHKSLRKGSRRSRRGSRILQRPPDDISATEKPEQRPISIEQLLKGTAEQLDKIKSEK